MIFEALRKIILPFDQIEAQIPGMGKILDVGCGHGVFAEILAMRSSNRKVLGIDPSKEKIILAKRDHSRASNVSYQVGFVQNLSKCNFDSSVILDVLYLLPDEQKVRLLAAVHKRLKKGGKLYLKEVENKPLWMYYFMLFEEFLMVKVLKLTYSDHDKFYILSRRGYKDILKKAGFQVTKNIPIRGLLPYPHILFVCSKR